MMISILKNRSYYCRLARAAASSSSAASLFSTTSNKNAFAAEVASAVSSTISTKTIGARTLPPLLKQQASFFSTSNNSNNNDDEQVEEPRYVTVSIDEARTTTARALKQIGWDDEDANLQAEIMTSAELCGNNQGLVKMYQPAMMAPSPDYGGKPKVERFTLNSAVLNGNQSPGMLAAVTGADMAVDILENNHDLSISIVSTYNTSTSSGQLGYYVGRMSERGYIGLAMCNSPEFVAAAKGGKGVFGTNPLAVGIPQSDEIGYPFTFDMATSAIALYGVLSAKAKNEPLPPNVAYGQDGNWTTDASEALEGGAILTFGGHKGTGLSLCVEILAGALSGGAVLGQVESKKVAKSWGHTFVAIRHENLVDDFPSKVSSIIKIVKESGDNIRIPGERSAKTAQERRDAGVMPIPEEIWNSIVNTADNGLPKE